MIIILMLLLLVVSFFLLWKGADWLVDGASGIAAALKISPVIIGLTIVAFATSMPEFLVALFASLEGRGDFAVANVVGSNIANICLVAGFAAILYPLSVRSRTLINEFPFMLISCFLFLILANNNNLFQINAFSIGRFEGIVFIIFLLLFMFYIYRALKEDKLQNSVKKEFEGAYKLHGHKLWTNSVFFFAGLLLLLGGARLLVYSGSNFAQIVGISERVIGLSIVSIGTSIPELFTCAVAALKKETDIAVGNVVGSNIFNILLVLGLVSLISPVSISPSMIYLDAVLMVFVSFLFVLFATAGRKLVMWEGATLLFIYVSYIMYIFSIF